MHLARYVNYLYTWDGGGRSSPLVKITWLAGALPLRPQNMQTHPDPPPKGVFVKGVETALQSLNGQQYHGGAFVGNHVNKSLQVSRMKQM